MDEDGMNADYAFVESNYIAKEDCEAEFNDDAIS